MGVGPWLMCFGIFVVVPLVAFVIGYKVGRDGLPFRVEWKDQAKADEFREFG
jgi:hypothetical protein